MKKLEYEDCVLFDNATQLLEYEKLSGDEDIEPVEWNDFPRIQSKHWSFHCNFKNGKHFSIKATALNRLISYSEYKRINIGK